MSNRAGRKQALARLVEMRREIEKLINELSGDEERAFVRTLEAGESHSIRTPRPGEVVLDPEVIEDRYGIVEDHSGQIPPAFQERFAKQLGSEQVGVAPNQKPPPSALAGASHVRGQRS